MWLYSQSTGRVTKDDKFYGVGYAGNNKEGRCKDNPLAQNIKNHGPLPQATYTMTEVVEGTHMGPFAIKLLPEPSSQMFGRSEFYIHGDDGAGTASDGCICVSQVLRKTMWDSDDKKVQVIP